MTTSLDSGYFDALYTDTPDPWNLATSPYEVAKYSDTLAILPRDHYAAAVEIGCSIGTLTTRLAPRCDRLLGIDVAEAALRQARARCAEQPQVAFACLQLPDQRPDGPFDLLMLSEVLYYFDVSALLRLATAVRALARPGADMLLVHWLGPTPDYPLTGDSAVAAFEAALGDAVRLLRRERRQDYRMDLFRLP
ncbi:MAG: hypothetical protein RL490_2673 [Pseudomonadota bacterium]|jgi:predicted TPR repeat methyltransferase